MGSIFPQVLRGSSFRDTLRLFSLFVRPLLSLLTSDSARLPRGPGLRPVGPVGRGGGG